MAKAANKDKRELLVKQVYINGHPYLYWFYFDKETNLKMFNKIKRQKQTA